MFALLTLFAQAENAADGKGPPGFSMLPMLLIIGVMFLLIVVMPARKQQKQQQVMLRELKRNDKVITTSGIIGIVVEVRDKKDEDVKEDEVVLRVDDSSNTRMRVLKSSIARVFPVGAPVEVAKK
jgi:preprotein translocase subunit YajC